jgi:hypothetical protein
MVAQPNYGLSTDTTLGGNSPSDIISPSEKAIKTYVDNHSGSSITVDDEMSASSENPVQNKVITAALEDKEDAFELGDGLEFVSGGQEIQPVVTLPYTFTDSYSGVQFFNNLTSDETKTAVFKIPSSGGFYYIGNDSRRGIRISRSGDDIWLCDARSGEQYNEEHFTSSTDNYLKIISYNGGATDVFYSHDNSTWTLLMDKDRANQLMGFGTEVGIYVEVDLITVDYFKLYYGDSAGGSNTLAVDDTIARVSDIPTITDTYSGTSSDGMSGKAVASALANSGFITGISSSDVTTALGYIPYDSSNPSGYTTNVGTVVSVNNTSPDSSGNVTLSIPAAQVNSDWNASSGVAQILNKPTIPTITDTYSGTSSDGMSGKAVASALSNSGFITGITSSDVTTALGYTPYNGATNPNGYTSNVGTVTSVNSVSPVNGNVTLSIPTVTDTYSATSSNAMSGKAVASAISGKADSATTLSGYGITDAYTKTEVDGMVASVYKPAGSIAFASRPTPGKSYEGNVYNITDAFTTDSTFVEGSGKSYPAGTNIVCINTTGTTYKWDVLSGIVDLSGYVPTSRTINGKALTGDITLSASDVSALPSSTTIPTITDTYSSTSSDGMSGKAVASALANSGFISGITSSMVTTALGYTPYSSANPSGYQANVIETVKVNGTALTPSSKAVDVTVPTKISDLTDDTATYPVDKADTLTGLTATITELNYVDGVTSAIQTQLNGKQTTSNLVTSVTSSSTDAQYPSAKCLYTGLNGKQATLVSGTNIKTINNTSLLGSGDISIGGTQVTFRDWSVA